MIETITFFKNRVTQYEVMHHFRLSLSKGLEKNGIKTHLVELADLSVLKKSLYSNPPDFTLAFNGLQPSSDGHFLCEELEIPHVAWLVDSADYFHDLAKCPLNILIAPDQQSRDLLTSWGSKNAYFLPHAFDEDLVYHSENRPLPLVFLGSLMDPIEVEELWKTHLPPSLKESLIGAAEKTLKSPYVTYQMAFSEVINAHPDFFEFLSPRQISDFATTLDRYIRARDRIDLLKSLKGLPVHIYGNCLSKRSWGDFIESDEYSIHPAVDFPEAIKIMKNAKMVINSSPMFKTGAHERIFYGLGLGCAVVTNETPWLEAHFSNDEIIMHSERDLVESMLSNPKKLKEMVEKGQEKVLREHTWKVRAKQLIDILEKITLE